VSKTPALCKRRLNGNPVSVLQADDQRAIIAGVLTAATKAPSASSGGGAMTKDEERELHDELARLLQEHRDLDAAIAALQHSPGSDILQVQRLKKRKLQLKDRIGFIEDQLTPDIIA
jgi:hypothetical protein